MFIRGSQDFKKNFANKKFEVEEWITRFTLSFPEFANKTELTEGALVAISSFSGFMNSIYEKMRRIKHAVKDILKKFDLLVVAYQKVDESLADYEANVMNEYGGSQYVPIFTELTKFTGSNPYNQIYNWVKMEQFDIRAMVECLASFDDLQVQRDKQ